MNTAQARRVHFGLATKYKARSTIDADGIKHASAKQAKRWRDLLLLERAARIRNLDREVTFRIKAPDGTVICRYIADHVYEEYRDGAWVPIVEDCKGYPTPVYKLKKKLMKLLLGIEIRET